MLEMINALYGVYELILSLNLDNYISWTLTYVSIVTGILLVVLEKITDDCNKKYNTKEYIVIHHTIMKLKLSKIKRIFYLTLSLISIALFGELVASVNLLCFLSKLIYLVVSVLTIITTIGLPMYIIKNAESKLH